MRKNFETEIQQLKDDLLLLGSMVYDLAQGISRQRQDTWAAWEDVSRAAERGVAAPGPGTG